ncbi:hypothetical protein, partial [Corynebacterium parakroppenstedtii]
HNQITAFPVTGRAASATTKNTTHPTHTPQTPSTQPQNTHNKTLTRHHVVVYHTNQVAGSSPMHSSGATRVSSTTPLPTAPSAHSFLMTFNAENH